MSKSINIYAALEISYRVKVFQGRSSSSMGRMSSFLCHLGRHSWLVGCSFWQIFGENFRWASDHSAPNLSPWTGLPGPDFGDASASPPSEFSSRAARRGGQTSCGEQQQTSLLLLRQRLYEAFLELSCPPALCISFFCRVNSPNFLNGQVFYKDEKFKVCFPKKNHNASWLVVGQFALQYF